MTNFFRLQFVFSSFGPLFALMAVVFVVQNRPRSAAVAGLLALCAFVTFLALATGMKRKSPSFEVVRVDARASLRAWISTFSRTSFPTSHPC